jgi:ABC-type uncharacterized transport system substrate-binding protein
LLKEIVPEVPRIAVLRGLAPNVLELREREEVARALGVQLQLLEVRDPHELDRAFSAMTSEHAGALVVLADPFWFPHRKRLAALAIEHRLPAVFGGHFYAEAGGLISYGANAPAMYRRGAYYVDKILKGAVPADLPIERPTKFELVINLKTAQAIGLTIPPTLLFQADEVIR